MKTFRTLILQAFQSMKQGSLNLSLPDGKEMRFGNGEGDIKADIAVRSEDFFKKCVLYGDIGFGEAFVDGDWTSSDLTAAISWFILNGNHPEVGNKPRSTNWLKVMNRILHWMRDNNLVGSRRNIQAHYDLGNEFFKYFLDPTMTYSSAYFIDGEETLEQAQLQKYEALCRKLKLQPSDHVLEIGSGWGGFCEYAAGKYGCRITSITISKEQLAYAQKRIQSAGLSDRVEVKFCDYRHITGSFDKIVSIEMIEAVGHKYYADYFAQCARLLKPEGILAVQMILIPDQKYEAYRKDVDWIQKHIFPGSLLPSIARVHWAIRKTGNLELIDLEDMAFSYARTLALWRMQFKTNQSEIEKLGFDECFARKWDYYFSYCEAAFKMRAISVAQVIYSRANNRKAGGLYQQWPEKMILA